MNAGHPGVRAEGPARRGTLPRPVGFGIASGALAGVFLASGSPIPLYNLFRVEDGLSDAHLAIATVAYLGVTALSLLVLGRLSDHLGRKPVGLIAVLAAIAGLVVMAFVHDPATLVAARMLQGIGCGLASSALGSWLIDLAPARPAWLPAVMTGTVPPFVLPLGALASGALAEYGPAPRLLMFAVIAGVLAVLAVLLVLTPETVRRTPGVLASLRPRVYVPAGQGRLLFGVGAALVATWSFSGFYQAFAPSITADYLGTANRFVIAVVFASIVVLSPIGGLIAARMRRGLAIALGLGVFVLGATGAVASLHAGAIVPFLVASSVAGIAQGLVSAGGMAALLRHTPPAQRAGLLASVYLISYSGAAIPGLVSGQLTTVLVLPVIADGYALLVIAASAAAGTALLLRRPGLRGSTAPGPAS